MSVGETRLLCIGVDRAANLRLADADSWALTAGVGGLFPIRFLSLPSLPAFSRAVLTHSVNL